MGVHLGVLQGPWSDCAFPALFYALSVFGVHCVSGCDFCLVVVIRVWNVKCFQVHMCAFIPY